MRPPLPVVGLEEVAMTAARCRVVAEAGATPKADRALATPAVRPSRVLRGARVWSAETLPFLANRELFANAAMRTEAAALRRNRASRGFGFERLERRPRSGAWRASSAARWRSRGTGVRSARGSAMSTASSRATDQAADARMARSPVASRTRDRGGERAVDLPDGRPRPPRPFSLPSAVLRLEAHRHLRSPDHYDGLQPARIGLHLTTGAAGSACI
jgi:hypothetical protein